MGESKVSRERRLGNYIVELGEIERGANGMKIMSGRTMWSTSRAVTINTVRRKGANTFDELLRFEIETMARVRGHPHVIQLLEILVAPARFFFVLEAATGRDLFNTVASKTRLEERVVRKYFRQLVYGVHHCHCRGVFHRNLKLESILLDQNGDVKIGGFTAAAHFAVGRRTRPQLKNICGTPEYLAPEMLEGQPYDGISADIWAIGVILYAMLEGFLPFKSEYQVELFAKIKRGKFGFTKDISPLARDLIEGILHPDPRKRLTLTEVSRHPWFCEDLADCKAPMTSEVGAHLLGPRGGEEKGNGWPGQGMPCPTEGNAGREMWVLTSDLLYAKCGKRWSVVGDLPKEQGMRNNCCANFNSLEKLFLEIDKEIEMGSEAALRSTDDCSASPSSSSVQDWSLSTAASGEVRPSSATASSAGRHDRPSG